MATSPMSIAVIGAGWRAEYILGVAARLPERFEIAGLVVRDPARAEQMTARWGAPVFPSLSELLAEQHPDFVVLSVPRDAAPPLIEECVRADVPVLTETPPADSLGDLAALWRAVGGAPVQVAEQYHLQPLISAQIALAREGVIGEVSECRVSISHGYHAVSTMRRLLGIGFEDAEVSALRFDAPLVGGPGRSGDPVEERVLTAETMIAHLDFGDRHGIYDWAPAQNRSWGRATRHAPPRARRTRRDRRRRVPVSGRFPHAGRVLDQASGCRPRHQPRGTLPAWPARGGALDLPQPVRAGGVPRRRDRRR